MLRRFAYLLVGLLAVSTTAQAELDDRLAEASARLEKGDFVEAEALYRRLVALYPQQVAPYQGLAEALAAQGFRDDAVELLIDLGQELRKLVRSDEAVAPLDLAVRLAPESFEASALLGLVLADEDRFASAAEALQKATSLGDHRSKTLLALARCLREGDDWAKAEEIYQEIRAEHGDSVAGLRGYGEFLLWRGRAIDAEKLLSEAVDKRPEDARLQALLGRARAEAGDFQGAVASYEKALELEPNLPHLRPALELARARLGRQVTLSPLDDPGRDQGAVFTDVASEAGITFRHDPGTSPDRHLPETMGSGLAWLDYDGDGLLDLYLVQSGPFPPEGQAGAANVLYRNRGDGAFVDRTDAAGVGDRCYGQGVLAADFDGDGDTDLYLTCFGADVLLDNTGDGRFVDVTRERGLGADGWTSSAAAADADGDGDLDLYVTRYVGYGPERGHFCGNTVTGEPDYCNVNFFAGDDDLLYLQDGDGRFQEVTIAAGIGDAAGRGLGVVWTDLDGDLRPDLYVANDLDFNRLYQNLGDGRFDDVSMLSGAAFSREGKAEASMGLDTADFDGDGLPEIVLSHFDVETNTLYKNLDDLQFDDASATSGFGLPSFNLLGFGLAVADFDLDGHLDAYIANGHIFEHPTRETTTRAQRDLLVLGNGRGAFSEQRLDPPHRIGRGAAVADVDNDGDPDLGVQNSGDVPFLWRNDSVGKDRARSRWLGVRLQGSDHNSEAIGARVTLITDQGRHTRWIKAGRSYQSSADRRLLFSLTRETPEAIEVTWPAGRTVRWPQPPEGRYLRFTEVSRDLEQAVKNESSEAQSAQAVELQVPDR